MNTDNSEQSALGEAVVNGGLERIPFFNGRVLTAEDLKTEQDANAVERRRLGRALGGGVVDGLFVRKTSAATVTVEPGFGLAPSGHVVHLPREVEVSVVSSIEREATTGTQGKFEDCAVQSATITTGAGAYLLVAEPASKTRGRTPRTSLGGDGSRQGVAGECGAKRRVEGAKLRLVPFDTGDEALVPPHLADGDASDNGDSESDGFEGIRTLAEHVVEARERGEAPTPRFVSLLRNVLAHVCLRTPSVLNDTASLYDTLRRQARGKTPSASESTRQAESEGPFDVLRRRARQRDRVDDLDDAVPLGLVYWSSDRIEFVDAWSVRRRIHRPAPQQPTPATARRRAETAAAIYQFQDHVADLIKEFASYELDWLRVMDHFAYLPPVGIIPISTDRREGFLESNFFKGLATRNRRPPFIEGEILQGLMEDALRYKSFRVDSDRLTWRYRVREDVQTEGEDDAASFLVFTSGALPYAADPQYNLSRWDYANFGPGVASR